MVLQRSTNAGRSWAALLFDRETCFDVLGRPVLSEHARQMGCSAGDVAVSGATLQGACCEHAGCS
eukprot:4869200-Alexandrium_andersonii.AAC.1